MHSVKTRLKSWVPVSLMVILLIIIIASGCTGTAGPQGPAGATGPTGPAGPQGPPGPTPTTPPPAPAPVVVNLGAAQTAQPGASVSLKAAVTINDKSTIQSYQWTQTSGPKATLANATTDTLGITLPSASAYKDQLMASIELKDRFMVQPINPHSLEAAEICTFNVKVTTSSGSYNGTVTLTANLPYVISTGLSDVGKGEPVLLNGKVQAAYDWAIVGPTGSTASVRENLSRNPSFTPDVVGKYTLTEKKSGAAIDVYAGTWAGAITGQNAQGRPLSANCTTCHNGKIASDNFTAWRDSGHAEIFTQNINDPVGHWAITCAGCHTVGYNPDAVNNGFDEAVAAEKWVVPPHGEVGLWTTILKNDPKTASLANIQCENCHGPNDGSTLHANGKIDAARVSIAADVCGSCHGEPARHGRFQQWEESKHAGTDTTPARAIGNASCARCHSGQGFLAWIAQGDLTKQIQGANGNATAAELAAMGISADKVEPITCAVCHDPHAEGTISGEPTAATRPSSATVRVMDVTALLPAGFKAEDVGKGALCITCHNTRNAIHGDDIAIASYSAPHTASQGDVLMGQNSFFVERGFRSPHASLIDTCVTCHMEKTPPPAEFSYQLSGTNHDFAASIKICADCHSDMFNGKAFQLGIAAKEEELGEAMGDYLLKKMGPQVIIKDYTPHTFNNKSYDVKSDGLTINKDNIASAFPTEPHGQQGFLLKFKTPVTFTYAPTGESPHTMTVTEAEVQLGDVSADGKTALIAFTDNLVKAGWNFFLIEGDGSKGVHNPEFSVDVLEASIVALK